MLTRIKSVKLCLADLEEIEKELSSMITEKSPALLIIEAQRYFEAISDLELAEKAELVLNKLCKTGGQSFTMTVPPSIYDTDMILSELIERFKKLITKK